MNIISLSYIKAKLRVIYAEWRGSSVVMASADHAKGHADAKHVVTSTGHVMHHHAPRAAFCHYVVISNGWHSGARTALPSRNARRGCVAGISSVRKVVCETIALRPVISTLSRFIVRERRYDHHCIWFMYNRELWYALLLRGTHHYQVPRRVSITTMAHRFLNLLSSRLRSYL